jgi:hypothetical protein
MGVTAIDTNVGGGTVSFVMPDTLPFIAVIVLLPAATAVASPVPLIVAVPELDEDHVT